MKEVVQHPYSFESIPARLITVNRNYQRDAKSAEINKIVSEFDYHLVNPVKVVKRDGFYYAWDGQQTAAALFTKFGKEYLVPCLVYYDIDTSKEEARLLVGCNTNGGAGKKLTALEIWKALIWQDDETALKIKKILDENGFKVSAGGSRVSKYTISAINAVQSAYKTLTEKQFLQMLRIVKESWNGDPDSLSATIIKAMTRFVKTYDGKFNEQNLIRRLSKRSPLEIIRNGRTSLCKGDAKWAREILAIYNNGTTTNRLPDLFA
jgi:hypothetical protein